MKYVVFDGYALAYRAFYGFPKLTNDKGRQTSVTVGFFKIVQSTLTKYELLDHKVIFVFDSPEPVFRKEYDSEYKANRSKKEQTFYDQLEEVISLCRRIWTVYRMPGYEADDLAGSFIQSFVSEKDSCVLITVDKDWLQLLESNVKALILSTQGSPKWVTDLSFFNDNSGIAPKGLIDLKALTGDGSDNIPGIKGIGWVAATKLIKQYETVEKVYDNILLIPNKGKLQTLLIENKDRVLLNKKLATIITDLNLEAPKLNLDAIEFGSFLDYLDDELNAVDLANQLGLLFQQLKENGYE